MELPGVNPLGWAAAFAVEAAPRKTQQLNKVDEGSRAQGTGTDSRRHPEQDRTAAAARDLAALRQEMERRALPAGPPPAFEMNLLQAEAGLDQALARIEATRAQERDATAFGSSCPGARPDAPEAGHPDQTPRIGVPRADSGDQSGPVTAPLPASDMT